MNKNMKKGTFFLLLMSAVGASNLLAERMYTIVNNFSSKVKVSLDIPKARDESTTLEPMMSKTLNPEKCIKKFKIKKWVEGKRGMKWSKQEVVTIPKGECKDYTLTIMEDGSLNLDDMPQRRGRMTGGVLGPMMLRPQQSRGMEKMSETMDEEVDYE